MKKDLTKYYDRLTPRERWLMVLEAAAKDDLEEMKQLIDACPRRTYEMSDRAFTDLANLSQHFTMAFALLASDLLASVKGLETTLLAAEAGARFAFVGLLGDKKFPDQALPLLEARIDDAWKGLKPEHKDILQGEGQRQLDNKVAELKSIYQGFECFCEKIEVNAELLIRSWTGPWADSLFEKLEQYEDQELSEEAEEVAEEYCQMLCSKWRTLGPCLG